MSRKYLTLEDERFNSLIKDYIKEFHSVNNAKCPICNSDILDSGEIYKYAPFLLGGDTRKNTTFTCKECEVKVTLWFKRTMDAKTPYEQLNNIKQLIGVTFKSAQDLKEALDLTLRIDRLEGSY